MYRHRKIISIVFNHSKLSMIFAEASEYLTVHTTTFATILPVVSFFIHYVVFCHCLICCVSFQLPSHQTAQWSRTALARVTGDTAMWRWAVIQTAGLLPYRNGRPNTLQPSQYTTSSAWWDMSPQCMLGLSMCPLNADWTSDLCPIIDLFVTMKQHTQP